MTRLTREEIDARNTERATRRLAKAAAAREANATVEHRKKKREWQPFKWPSAPAPKERTGEFYTRPDVSHIPAETNERMRLRRQKRAERRA